jgi:hypothetical protein
MINSGLGTTAETSIYIDKQAISHFRGLSIYCKGIYDLNSLRNNFKLFTMLMARKFGSKYQVNTPRYPPFFPTNFRNIDRSYTKCRN